MLEQVLKLGRLMVSLWLGSGTEFRKELACQTTPLAPGLNTRKAAILTVEGTEGCIRLFYKIAFKMESFAALTEQTNKGLLHKRAMRYLHYKDRQIHTLKY